jgi:hypothetical protein
LQYVDEPDAYQWEGGISGQYDRIELPTATDVRIELPESLRENLALDHEAKTILNRQSTKDEK